MGRTFSTRIRSFSCRVGSIEPEGIQRVRSPPSAASPPAEPRAKGQARAGCSVGPLGQWQEAGAGGRGPVLGRSFQGPNRRKAPQVGMITPS